MKDGSLGVILVSLVHLFWILCKKSGPFCVSKRHFFVYFLVILDYEKNIKKTVMDKLCFFFEQFWEPFWGPFWD